MYRRGGKIDMSFYKYKCSEIHNLIVTKKVNLLEKMKSMKEL